MLAQRATDFKPGELRYHPLDEMSAVRKWGGKRCKDGEWRRKSEVQAEASRIWTAVSKFPSAAINACKQVMRMYRFVVRNDR